MAQHSNAPTPDSNSTAQNQNNSVKLLSINPLLVINMALTCVYPYLLQNATSDNACLNSNLCGSKQGISETGQGQR